jgi:hypothetical protein
MILKKGRTKRDNRAENEQADDDIVADEHFYTPGEKELDGCPDDTLA